MQNYHSIGTGMRLVVIAIAASIAMFIALLCVAWYFDDISSKPFNERSYPASRSY